ncbi:MAG TPA: hypothetical protein VIK35_08870 [Verrucomicrobiae bacterium]
MPRNKSPRKLSGIAEKPVQVRRSLPSVHNYDAWTAEDMALLGKRPDREIAELLGRTVRAIESQRHRLGILRQPSIRIKLRPWKRKDVRLLGTMTDRAVAARIGRSEVAVRTQRLKLGIPAADQRRSLNARKTYPMRPWTPQETMLAGTTWDGKVAAQIGRSEVSVRMRRKKLGIPAFAQRPPRKSAIPPRKSW